MLTQVTSKKISPRVHRIAVGAVFFLAGLCFASWASRIPTIQHDLGLSETSLGMVLLALPVGLMISLPFSGWVITKVGSRLIATISSIIYGSILVALGLSQNVYQLVLSLFLFGFAGNMLNISVNTQAVGVEALYKRPIMASFHGIWSLAGFSGAAIGTLMLALHLNPYQHFLMIFVLVLIIIAVCNRYILNEDVNSDVKQPMFAKPDKSLINLGIIAFCCMICEGTMFDWSGVYFKKVVHAEGAWIGAGYSAFMITMASGRFVADYFTHRFGLKKIMQFSGVLIAAGLLLAVIFPQLLTALIGFLLVGFGVSSVVPLIYSEAGKSKTMSPGVALAAVSTIGFLGFLSGPPLIGLVAGATSLKISFLIIAFMGLSVSIIASKSKSLGK